MPLSSRSIDLIHFEIECHICHFEIKIKARDSIDDSEQNTGYTALYPLSNKQSKSGKPQPNLQKGPAQSSSQSLEFWRHVCS